MNTFILKIYTVVPGEPKHDYECEGKIEHFRNESDALQFANWWKFDQGREDTIVRENYVSCAVVDNGVIVPLNIQ